MKITPTFIEMIVKVHNFFKGSHKAASFFNTPNLNLGGSTPALMILMGRQDKLQRWVHESLPETMESKLASLINSYMIVPPNHYISFPGIWIEKRYLEDDTFLWAAFMGQRNSLSKKNKMFLIEGSNIVTETDISDRRYSSLNEVIVDLSAFLKNERCEKLYFSCVLKHIHDNFPQELRPVSPTSQVTYESRVGGSFSPMCDSFDCRCNGC